MSNLTTTLISFPKVVSVKFGYKNQFGQLRKEIPSAPTFLSSPIEDEAILAIRTKRGELDTWYPTVIFYLGWRSVEFSGQRATDMYSAYRKWLFKE